jgi:hypothetical protein
MKDPKGLSPHLSSADTNAKPENLFSLYFQAHVKKELCWMVSSTLKYVDHVAFDRTIEKEESLFEFFVSPDREDDFLDMMDKLAKIGVILTLQKLPNRLIPKD